MKVVWSELLLQRPLLVQGLDKHGSTTGGARTKLDIQGNREGKIIAGSRPRVGPGSKGGSRVQG